MLEAQLVCLTWAHTNAALSTWIDKTYNLSLLNYTPGHFQSIKLWSKQAITAYFCMLIYCAIPPCSYHYLHYSVTLNEQASCQKIMLTFYISANHDYVTFVGFICIISTFLKWCIKSADFVIRRLRRWRMAVHGILHRII